MLGLKHAIEADHLAAVSTIVTERKSVLNASIVGGMWGVGHTISSPFVGLLYIAVFGLGSIGGMMLMSAAVGLPVQLMAGRSARAHPAVRAAAGLFSLCFGLFMAYRIGYVDGLFR